MALTVFHIFPGHVTSNMQIIKYQLLLSISDILDEETEDEADNFQTGTDYEQLEYRNEQVEAADQHEKQDETGSDGQKKIAAKKKDITQKTVGKLK